MVRLFCLVALAGLVVGCARMDSPQNPAAVQPQPKDEAVTTAPANLTLKKLAAEHLPNPVQVHPKVISGGLPEGDAAFAELQALGVKTIISVDGAKPDVETAAEYGMRYVHLPHGYDGISDARVKELAKAVRDLEGPIYIHCHHGKHRSPAAASVACVAAGLIQPQNAMSVLELAGTSQNFHGLYESVQSAEPLEKVLLDELSVEFHETVELPPMIETMVSIEHTHDHLQAFARSGWEPPTAHPDLDPAHEALLLREHFTELLRADYMQDQPAEFREILRDSQLAAEALETELREWNHTDQQSSPPAALQHTADRITKNCQECHRRLRDIPLSQKQNGQ